VEVVASLSHGRIAAAQCGLFTHKSVPVIFEPPCNSPPRTLLWKKKGPNITPHYEPCSGDAARHDLRPSSARFLTLQHIQERVYGCTFRLIYLWLKKPISTECEAGWSSRRDYNVRKKNLPSAGCRTPIPRSLISGLNKCIELLGCVIHHCCYFKSQKSKH